MAVKVLGKIFEIWVLEEGGVHEDGGKRIFCCCSVWREVVSSRVLLMVGRLWRWWKDRRTVKAMVIGQKGDK
jgi:hypothetical protein